MNIHPIRATLAVGTLAVTAFLLVTGKPIADAWWAIVGVVNAFYFVDSK